MVPYCSTLMAAATAKGWAWRDQLVKVLMEATLGQPAPRPDEACEGGEVLSQAPPPLQELLQGCTESAGMPDLLPALMHSDHQRQQERESGGTNTKSGLRRNRSDITGMFARQSSR